MFAYRDMTFCTLTDGACGNEGCIRRWDAGRRDGYERWAATFSNPNNAMVAKSEFRDTEFCPGWMEPKSDPE